MVICFLKRAEEAQAECHVEKFLDRIWFDESGNAEILRTSVIRVNPQSRQSVTGCCMLADRRLPKDAIHNVSDTGLNESFFWNQRESRPVQINNLAKRIITYDGLSNLHVPEKAGIRIVDIGNFSIIEIAFNRALTAGEGIFLRLRLKVPAFADRQSNGNLNFDVKYLCSDGARHALDQLDVAHREIPVLSITDEETKFGGFDVFLTPPEGTQITAEALSPNMRGRTTRDPDGNAIAARPNRNWRLRFALKEEKSLKRADSGINIAGAAIRDDLAERFAQLSANERKHHILNIVWHAAAIVIGLLALIIALSGK